MDKSALYEPAPTPCPLLGIGGQLSVFAVFVCLCFVLILKVGSVLPEKDEIDNLKREQPSPLWSGRASISLAISQPNLMSFLMMGKSCSSKPCRQGPFGRRGKARGFQRLRKRGYQWLAPQGAHSNRVKPATEMHCPHLPQASATRCQCTGLGRHLW